MRVPEILTPFVAKGITRIPEQVLTYWKDSLIYIFPPGSTLTLTYRPRSGHFYLIFGMTLGTTRDHATGDEVITDDYGFWHRHGQMRWHWDPQVESVYETDYPHWLEVTDTDPLELEWVNGSAYTIIQDISIWILECTKQHWDDLVVPYLRGLYRSMYQKGLKPMGTAEEEAVVD